MGQRLGTISGWMCAVLLLSGCMSSLPTLLPDTKNGVARNLPGPDSASLVAAQQDADGSQIIAILMERRSAIPDGSSYDRVANSVLSSNSRPAEAKLRSARLRAEAASKNWLPTLGPQISLTNLSSIAANLVVDQVLFANGRKKAERAFAKADVEVAAVSLAEETNNRVFTALSLYLDAQKAREQSALSEHAGKDMAHFAWIMEERVNGGVSDMSDLTVLRQKLAEIHADQSTAREVAKASLAELNSMTVMPVALAPETPALPVAEQRVEALAVLRAEAEKTRAIEMAKVERAGYLPSLTASATIGSNAAGPGLVLGSGKPFGFGTGASLKAIEATTDAAARQVAQTREDSDRNLNRLRSEISALSRQTNEAAQLSRDAKRNLDIFQRQYDAGQRQVMEVVGVYETYARQQRHYVDLKYQALRAQLQLARDLGVLADGGRI